MTFQFPQADPVGRPSNRFVIFPFLLQGSNGGVSLHASTTSFDCEGCLASSQKSIRVSAGGDRVRQRGQRTATWGSGATQVTSPKSHWIHDPAFHSHPIFSQHPGHQHHPPCFICKSQVPRRWGAISKTSHQSQVPQGLESRGAGRCLHPTEAETDGAKCRCDAVWYGDTCGDRVGVSIVGEG